TRPLDSRNRASAQRAAWGRGAPRRHSQSPSTVFAYWHIWCQCLVEGSDASRGAVSARNGSRAFQWPGETSRPENGHTHRPRYECRSRRGAGSPYCQRDRVTRTWHADQMLLSLDWQFDVPIAPARIFGRPQGPVRNTGPTVPTAERTRGRHLVVW